MSGRGDGRKANWRKGGREGGKEGRREGGRVLTSTKSAMSAKAASWAVVRAGRILEREGGWEGVTKRKKEEVSHHNHDEREEGGREGGREGGGTYAPPLGTSPYFVARVTRSYINGMSTSWCVILRRVPGKGGGKEKGREGMRKAREGGRKGGGGVPSWERTSAVATSFSLKSELLKKASTCASMAGHTL